MKGKGIHILILTTQWGKTSKTPDNQGNQGYPFISCMTGQV